MPISTITSYISSAITRILPIPLTGSDRRLHQVVHPESGSVYELFKSKDGSLSVWQTDPDGICTLWDCGDERGDEHRMMQEMDVNAYCFCCY